MLQHPEAEKEKWITSSQKNCNNFPFFSFCSDNCYATFNHFTETEQNKTKKTKKQKKNP